MKQYNRYFTDKGQFEAQAVATMMTRVATAISQVQMARDDLAEIALALNGSPDHPVMDPSLRAILLKELHVAEDDLHKVNGLLSSVIKANNRIRETEVEAEE